MAVKPTSEKIADAARGEDKPIDEKRPAIPYVFMTAYPIILIVALLGILAYILISRWQ